MTETNCISSDKLRKRNMKFSTTRENGWHEYTENGHEACDYKMKRI